MSTQAEPTQAEPTHAEPTQAEPTQAEPTGAELADHLPQRDMVADMKRADYRLVGGAYQAMVDADDGLSGDGTNEGHRALGGRQHRLPRLGGKINSAMAGRPRERRRIEPSLHHRRSAQWPAGWCRQPSSSHSRSRNRQHPEADHDEEWRLDKSTEGSHAGSLRMSRQIVHACAHLWMTDEGPLAFVDRLACADLPSGLTSHACLPVFGLGGTFGLDL